MKDPSTPRTIRWDGTCKKCGVKTYWMPVAKKAAHVDPYKSGGLIGFICLLCYYKKQDDITNGKSQKCTVGELLEETRRGSRL